MQDRIEYELLVQNALRHVVRDVLSDVAKAGALPGEHHFYITFNTQAAGVQISARLKQRFPESMTIVLQHRFWDMKVYAEYFSVRLSFGGVPERLTVPFAAMQSFYDPSAAFEVAFSTSGEETADADIAQENIPADDEDIIAFPPKNRGFGQSGFKPSTSILNEGEGDKSPYSVPVPPAFAKALEKQQAHLKGGAVAGDKTPAADDAKSGDKEPQSASVVSLDAFRKK